MLELHMFMAERGALLLVNGDDKICIRCLQRERTGDILSRFTSTCSHPDILLVIMVLSGS
ncbi:hypothetical protein C5167_031092 [Papaver somniferum]|nr:hypothetical protein C5167_031092 [Papaver somniferum]